MTMQDFGKVRVYQCVCGGRCIRPLHESPKPCDRCEADLTIRPYQIDDHRLQVRDMLSKAAKDKRED